MGRDEISRASSPSVIAEYLQMVVMVSGEGVLDVEVEKANARVDGWIASLPQNLKLQVSCRFFCFRTASITFFVAPQSLTVDSGRKFSCVWMVDADKVPCYSHNRSVLRSNRSNGVEKCSKTLKRPEKNALGLNESWTGYWMMFGVQSWSRMVYYSQIVKRLSTFFTTLPWPLLTQLIQTGEGHMPDAAHILTAVHSWSFFKRSTTSFWQKHRRHHPVIAPTLAATSRMNPRPMGSASPHVRKQCILSHPVRHTQRGSCPLRSESRSRNLFRRRSNRAQRAVAIGRGPNKSRGVWASSSMARTLTGVVLRIQPRLRPWGLS